MHILQKDHVQAEESAAADSSTGDGDESVPAVIDKAQNVSATPQVENAQPSDRQVILSGIFVR